VSRYNSSFFQLKKNIQRITVVSVKNNKENTCALPELERGETYGRKEGYMYLDIRWKVYDMFKERIKETTNKSLNKQRAYKSSGLKA
jgi:hypothetical protein